MAALSWSELFGWLPLRRSARPHGEPYDIYEFADRVHKKTGGPTPALRQMLSENLNHKRDQEAGEDDGREHRRAG